MVKNVTGYDLCKLLAGSFGTLAAMTEVTIKTLPRPETEATVLVLGLDDAARQRGDDARRWRRPATCRPRRICRPAWSMHFDGLHVMQAATAFRLEGFAPSVAHRKAALDGAAASRSAPVEHVDESDSRALWRSVRDAQPFSAERAVRRRPLWRVSTAPARGARVRRACCRPARRWFYDWAGGLIWIALPPSDDAGAASIRRAVAATRRPRHARSRAGRDARRGRRVRAAAGARSPP